MGVATQQYRVGKILAIALLRRSRTDEWTGFEPLGGKAHRKKSNLPFISFCKAFPLGNHDPVAIQLTRKCEAA